MKLLWSCFTWQCGQSYFLATAFGLRYLNFILMSLNEIWIITILLLARTQATSHVVSQVSSLRMKLLRTMAARISRMAAIDTVALFVLQYNYKVVLRLLTLWVKFSSAEPPYESYWAVLNCATAYQVLLPLVPTFESADVILESEHSLLMIALRPYFLTLLFVLKCFEFRHSPDISRKKNTILGWLEDGMT